jgi:4-carboxymuconolactone decarboxylase
MVKGRNACGISYDGICGPPWLEIALCTWLVRARRIAANRYRKEDPNMAQDGTSPRFKRLQPSEFTPEQKQLVDKIAGGPRGVVRGPFLALLHSPELADRYQALGEQIRFNTSVPLKLMELAVLIVARHYTAQFEWYAHRKHAINAGLNPAICDAIAGGLRPTNMSNDEAAFYEFAKALMDKNEISDAQFASVESRFGQRGIADLLGTIGYYCAVALILNVDRYPIPNDGVPLKPR